ncbi:MAG: hypothetical protein KF691_13310 [Phycisphaeraceae bacterium]|nr:hypothetical protein [Phycisphaeraceae bacterium]
MSFFVFLLALWTPFATVGGLLLWKYARGRAVPGTSLCRACRFDLKGLSAAPACPECGKSLTTPNAIVPLRVRSKSRLWLGLLLAGIPFCASIAVVALSISKANFTSVKPFWLLKTEALHGAPAQSAEALTEINRRIRADSIAIVTWAPLVADAIQRRRTPSARWNRGWSEFIELARARGRVTDAEWTDYVRYSIQAFDLHRKKMRTGAEAVFGVTVTGAQLGTSPPASAQTKIQYGLSRASLDGHEIYRRTHALPTSATISANGSSGTAVHVAIDTPPTKSKLLLTYSFEAIDPVTDKSLGNWTQDFTDDVEVVPAETAIVESREDAALVPAIRRALRVDSLSEGSQSYYSLMLNATNMPANVGFDVFVRARTGSSAGKLFSLGQISYLQGNSGGYGIGAQITEPMGDAVDVILRPSVSAGEKNTFIDWIWTGPDITFEDLKVKRPAR